METYTVQIKKRLIYSTTFFISQSTLEHEDDTPPDLPRLDCQINDITLSVSEASNAIQNLDKGKATGPDQVHNRLLIASAAIIAEPLSKLFNRSLRENKFPAIWKVAHVTSLHKKEPKELCNNYRPISLLRCVGKLLERCVHKHVYNYLQYNNIITQSLKLAAMDFVPKTDRPGPCP